MYRACPICGKQIDPANNQGPVPFCSPRCKKVDLYQWLNEEYRLSEPLGEDVTQELQALSVRKPGVLS